MGRITNRQLRGMVKELREENDALIGQVAKLESAYGAMATKLQAQASAGADALHKSIRRREIRRSHRCRCHPLKRGGDPVQLDFAHALPSFSAASLARSSSNSRISGSSNSSSGSAALAAAGASASSSSS